MDTVTSRSNVIDYSNKRLLAENMEWLADFERGKGRKPRVLGIGNLANNAYKNALALRAIGVECDVMCNDYYHAMACPEWESGQFLVSGLSLTAPDWSACNLQGFERPEWFAQGSFGTCLEYLIARNEGSEARAMLWDRLATETRKEGKDILSTPIPDLIELFGAQIIAQRLSGQHDRLGLPGVLDANSLYWLYVSIFIAKHRLDRLFGKYDAVICYGTNGLFPLVSATVPYIAYEHGTIRELPFDGTLAGQICALVYKAASNVLITNCDNIIAAQRLGLDEIRFVPHAILEDWRLQPRDEMLRRSLLANDAFDFVVFSASRQHWSQVKSLSWEKANDVLIRGFAEFVKRIRPRARLVLVDWGISIGASKELIRDCGIERNVLWVEPMSVPMVGAYSTASDVVADQFLIGAWGAFMPIGLMLGVPTMSYVNEEVHRWCFPEMPPILNARTDEDVCQLLGEITNPQHAREVSRASVRWYDSYHSMAVVADRLLDATRSAIEKCQTRRDTTLEMEPPIYWLANHLHAKVTGLEQVFASLELLSRTNAARLDELRWVFRIGNRLKPLWSLVRKAFGGRC